MIHVLPFGPCLFEKRERESWRSMAEGAMIPSNWRREAIASGRGYFSGPFLRRLSSGRGWILASNITRCLSSASSRLSPMTASHLPSSRLKLLILAPHFSYSLSIWACYITYDFWVSLMQLRLNWLMLLIPWSMRRLLIGWALNLNSFAFFGFVKMWSDFVIGVSLPCGIYQVGEDLEGVTHKVYFDIQINGSPEWVTHKVYFVPSSSLGL